MLLLATATALCTALSPSVTSDAGVRGPEELGAFTLVATGDVMMHETIKQAAQDAGFDVLFANVAPDLRDADAAFANLETPVAPRANRGTRPFVFNAPRELLPALRGAGFTVVSFANNHAYDQGRAGVAETVENLADAGLAEVGAGRNRAESEAAVIIERHGLRIAFVGGTARFNEDLTSSNPALPTVQPAEAPALLASVRKLRSLVDAVVVSVHWGTEYQPEPEPAQQNLARTLVEAGALLVLGTHPHVLQRLEVLPLADGRTGLVAYSLGNFISNQSRDYMPGAVPPPEGDTRDGVLLRVTFKKRRYLGGQVLTEIADVSATPLWTENNSLARKRDTSLAPVVRVVDAASELAEARKALEPLSASAAQLTVAQQAHAVALQQRIELLQLREGRIADRLGPSYLRR